MTKKKIRVQVQKIHIDRATCGDPYNCPIAFALKDYFPDMFPYVAYDFVEIKAVKYGMSLAKYRLSRAASNFITKFDNKRTRRDLLKTFNFDMVRIK